VITVHDVLGRTVATLVDSDMSSGSHEVRWDATGLRPDRQMISCFLNKEIQEIEAELERADGSE
jgi:hypothetical protein